MQTLNKPKTSTIVYKLRRDQINDWLDKLGVYGKLFMNFRSFKLLTYASIQKCFCSISPTFCILETNTRISNSLNFGSKYWKLTHINCVNSKKQ